VGAFAIKVARAAGIHPVIAVGSPNSAFVTEYLDTEQGDVLVDYTAYATPQDLVAAIKEAALKSGVPDGRVPYAFDAVGESGTYDTILSTAMAVPQDAPTSGPRPRISVVIPTGEFPTADPSVDVIATTCGLAYWDGEHGACFAGAGLRMVTRGLTKGWFKGHPYEVVKGGLNGLEEALGRLKAGQVKARKLVVRLGDTEGI
jgi:NADPH2:quinone reductase